MSNERDEVRSDMLASLDLTRRRAWRAVSMITTRLCRVRYHWTPDPGPLDHVKSLFGLPVNDRPPSQASWLSAAKFVGTEANQTHASRKEKSGSPHSITKSSRAGTWLQHPSRKGQGAQCQDPGLSRRHMTPPWVRRHRHTNKERAGAVEKRRRRLRSSCV